MSVKLKSTLSTGALLALASFTFAQEIIDSKPTYGPVRGVETTVNPLIKSPRRFKKLPRPFTVLVSFKGTESTRTANQALASCGLYADKSVRSPFFVRTFISIAAQRQGMTIDKAIATLKSNPAVLRAEPDMPIFPDPDLTQQWGINNTGQSGGTAGADVRAFTAWPLVTSTTSVTLAVIDDAVQINHPDIAGNVLINAGEIAGNNIDDDGNGFIDDVNGWDFVSGDNDPNPPSTASSHGTHCAGIAAAVSGNAVGIASAGKNIKLLPIRMYDGQSGWISDLILSIDYARQRGSKVVSVSYNIDGYTQLLVDAIVRLGTADIVYVNSAGNSGALNPPRGAIKALAPNSTFVASTNRNDNISSFSNYGSAVEFGAPGEQIYSTVPYGVYDTYSGTSMATPFAASILATIRSQFPTLTAVQTISRAALTSDIKPQYAGKLQYGRLNMFRALQIDNVPPSDPGVPAVAKRSANVIRLDFASSGDDGAVGTASTYELRYSKSPITTANFASATRYSGEFPTGSTSVGADITGLDDASAYYFAVRAVDDVGNTSSIVLSNVATTTGVLFKQNMETTGNSALTPTGTWALTSAFANSGTRSWTDSPAGAYPANTNTTLTETNTFSITEPMNMSFAMKYDLEDTYDFLIVEASTNNVDWVPLTQITGTSVGFQQINVPLANFVGQSVRVRFRLTSDNSVQADGVYIDDVTLKPTREIYGDNAEGSSRFNTAGTTWVQSSEFAFSPTRAYNDLPGADYAANANQFMTGLFPIDASSVANPILSYFARIDLEDTYDFLNVFSQGTTETAWAIRSSISGTITGFNNYTATLPSKNLRIGISLTSDGSNQQSGAQVDDIKVIGEYWIQSLNLTLNLDGYIGTTPKTFNIRFRTPGTTTVLDSTVGNFTAASPSFTAETRASGLCDVEISCPGYLRRVVPNVSVNTFSTAIAADMVNGDINNDNAVSTADFNALRVAFGSNSASPNWNPAADLNGDGSVSTQDLNILRANFGKVGNN
jgi:subtilisin family serine protease